MAHVDAALKASREAVDHMMALAEQTSATWTTARAPGKWSPSQIVEHVAMTLEESAKVAAGQPSNFPRLPVRRTYTVGFHLDHAGRTSRV